MEDDFIQLINQDEERFIIYKKWKLGKCDKCGEIIHIIDDFIPYECPLCHKSRVD